MRTQGEARFTGRWQDRSTSTSIVLDSIAKQRALTEDEAILDNSRNRPQYSLVVTYVVGAVVLVCMGLGIWIGVVYGY